MNEKNLDRTLENIKIMAEAETAQEQKKMKHRLMKRSYFQAFVNAHF
jgi:hypothetical protein